MLNLDSSKLTLFSHTINTVNDFANILTKKVCPKKLLDSVEVMFWQLYIHFIDIIPTFISMKIQYHKNRYSKI